MKTKPNDPIATIVSEQLGQTIYDGLSKREYFVGLAMQGLLSNPEQIDTTNFEWVAQHAIGYADALIIELNKEK